MLANFFNAASVSALLSSVVSLVGGVGAWVLGGAPDWEDVRPLRWVGLTAAAVAACNFPATLDVAPALAVWAARVEVLAIALHVAAWYRYLLQWSGRPSTRRLAILLAPLLCAGALALVPGAVYGDAVKLRAVPWLGVVYRDPPVTLPGYAILAVIAGYAAAGVGRLVGLRGRGIPFHRTLVVVTALLLAMGLHDAVVVGGLAAPTPYLLDFGLYGPAFVIAVVTLRRVVWSATDLHRLRTGLELAVLERTSALARSEAALASSERLAALLRQVLVAGRVAAPVGPTVDVRVGPAVEAALAAARARIPAGVTIAAEVAPGLTVSGREVEVIELVQTLVLHATAGFAAGEGGTVSVRVTPSGERVRLAVEDDGAPLGDEALRHAFEPSRGGAGGRGSGLALALARGLAEGMGGTLRIEARAQERGFLALAELPRGAPDASLADLPAAPLAAPRRARVLVVDRDPGALRAIADALRAEHEVETAAGLREALDALGSRALDLVLCDGALPGVGAERFWQEVLLRAPEAQGKIAFLAAGGEPPAVLAFLARQPRPVLRKPPSLAEVNAALAASGFAARPRTERPAATPTPTGEIVGRLRRSGGRDPA